jgi:hypothetical protein
VGVWFGELGSGTIEGQGRVLEERSAPSAHSEPWQSEVSPKRGCLSGDVEAVDVVPVESEAPREISCSTREVSRKSAGQNVLVLRRASSVNHFGRVLVLGRDVLPPGLDPRDAAVRLTLIDDDRFLAEQGQDRLRVTRGARVELPPDGIRKVFHFRAQRAITAFGSYMLLQAWPALCLSRVPAWPPLSSDRPPAGIASNRLALAYDGSSDPLSGRLAPHRPVASTFRQLLGPFGRRSAGLVKRKAL